MPISLPRPCFFESGSLTREELVRVRDREGAEDDDPLEGLRLALVIYDVKRESVRRPSA